MMTKRTNKGKYTQWWQRNTTREIYPMVAKKHNKGKYTHQWAIYTMMAKRSKATKAMIHNDGNKAQQGQRYTMVATRQ